jgi:hypothetical protein
VYSTCLFCHASLGANEIIERFPVGSRLAFDSAKGRLWVVCPRCGRWNLTPLEERWEAVEDCERRFRSQRLREQTTNIGLARLPSGLQLIRIGAPLAPELAAWRYGQELGRRFRRGMGWTIGGGAVAAGALGGLFATGMIPPVFAAVLPVWAGIGALQYAAFRRYRPAGVAFDGPVRVPSGIERPFMVFEQNALETTLLPGEGESAWSIALVHARGRTTLTGDVAPRALGVLLAPINRWGGSASTVEQAMQAVASVGPDRYPARLARDYAAFHAHDAGEIAHAKRDPYYGRQSGRYGPIDRAALPNLPRYERLALEMAVHEASEQRAIDGDLAPLEAAWREAEEIAAIADDMFLPESAQNLSRLKDK